MTLTWQLVLLVLAIVCAAVLALMGFDVVTAKDPLGWLGLTLALGLASRIP